MEKELGYYIIFRREKTDVYTFARHRNGSALFIQTPDINNPSLTARNIGEFCDEYQRVLRREFPNAEVQPVLAHLIPNGPSTAKDDLLSQALHGAIKKTNLEIKCSSVLPEFSD